MGQKIHLTEELLNQKNSQPVDDTHDRGLGYLTYLMENAELSEIALSDRWWASAKHRLLCSAIQHRLFSDESIESDTGCLIYRYVIALESRMMAS
jgi:hypothetical protein